MKKLITLLCIIVAPAVSHAAENDKPFDFLKNNPDFLRKYLLCGTTRAAVKNKPPEQQTCEQKAAIKYCNWADTLSEPVQKKIELDLACDFMAGELRGDNSEYDKEIIASVKSAGCFEASGKAIELLKTNWGKENDMRALLFFAGEYTDAMDACFKEKQAAKKATETKKEETKVVENTETPKAESVVEIPKAEPVKTETAKQDITIDTPKADEAKKEEPPHEKTPAAGDKKEEVKADDSQKDAAAQEKK